MSLEDLAPRVKELMGGLIAKPKVFLPHALPAILDAHLCVECATSLPLTLTLVLSSFFITYAPQMSDKLLGKPPFRFLHDVVSAVTAATGFAQGLYDTDMLDSSNITDKSGKIAYLETIFNMVGICRGHPIDVRAQKVVAGLEAGNTAVFLVALAECARDSNIDSDAAVRRARNGEVAGDGPAATKGGGGGGSGDEAKSESKSAASPARSSGGDSKGDNDGAKGFPDDAGPSAMGPPDGFGLDNVDAQERGKSRSGTRGNKVRIPFGFSACFSQHCLVAHSVYAPCITRL
jgi:hypothetical protein